MAMIGKVPWMHHREKLVRDIVRSRAAQHGEEVPAQGGDDEARGVRGDGEKCAAGRWAPAPQERRTAKALLKQIADVGPLAFEMGEVLQFDWNGQPLVIGASNTDSRYRKAVRESGLLADVSELVKRC